LTWRTSIGKPKSIRSHRQRSDLSIIKITPATIGGEAGVQKRSMYGRASIGLLRQRMLTARVVALKTRVMLHLPNACPDQAAPRVALERLPRLVC
jgi:hypothetical protein